MELFNALATGAPLALLLCNWYDRDTNLCFSSLQNVICFDAFGADTLKLHRMWFMCHVFTGYGWPGMEEKTSFVDIQSVKHSSKWWVSAKWCVSWSIIN